MELDASLTTTLAITIGVYLVVVFAMSILARRRIHDVADYVVAGRRLPLMLAWPTLLATWFGAGTLLAAADEVREGGLQAAALDPFGAGVCLILAGLFFARRLWDMQLITLADFYRRRFGSRAELLASAIMVPGYLGWIAAQFVALAGMLNLFFDLDMNTGIALVAAVGTGYTLIGGMWSVTLTDALQIALVAVGLVVLAVVALVRLGSGGLGDGLERLIADTPPDMLQPIPTESLSLFVGWLGVFCAGALGNLPGQDLMQRVFASKSALVARRACLIAGIAYLTFGLLPLVLALAGNLLAPEYEGQSILPLLAHMFLSPWMAVIFVLAILSAVLSTIDSAILSPATVLAQNILVRVPQRRLSQLQLNELAVVAIAAGSLAVAYLGEDAYSLLESAYELGMVSLLAPLVFGLFGKRGGEAAALWSMGIGIATWLVHLAAGWETFLAPLGSPLPMGLTCTALSVLAYLVAARAPAPKMPTPGG